MIYYAPDIPTDIIKDLPIAPKPRGNPGRKKRPQYYAVVCAFDIETTALKKIKHSVMYIWQLQIGFDITIIGRTWGEFLEVREKLAQIAGERKFVCYVHNLSYEFSFLSGIWHFAPEDVFCTEPRRILRADMHPFEFRCSYRLSNMSLAEFTKQMRVEHQKLSGVEFDYSKQRFSWTKLTPQEIAYCVNDVVGLVEAVSQLMLNEGDNLYSIVSTSTGYVRRDEKKAMRTYNWNTMRRLLPPYSVYLHLRKAFRGGNTHANRHFVGQVVRDVNSIDMASAYPAAMLLEFPMGRWYEPREDDYTEEYLRDLIQRRHKAVLLKVAFHTIQLRDPRWAVPYIPVDKCESLENYTEKEIRKRKNSDREYTKEIPMSIDNGRVMAAKFLVITITDVDLAIIADEYEWEQMDILYMACSTYGHLPAQIRETMLTYYERKTALKGVSAEENEEEAFLYDASKRKINALYGMMVQDTIQKRYLYVEKGVMNKAGETVPYTIDESKADEKIYNDSLNYATLSYAWGVWITCYLLPNEIGARAVAYIPARRKGTERNREDKNTFHLCGHRQSEIYRRCRFFSAQRKHRGTVAENARRSDRPERKGTYTRGF